MTVEEAWKHPVSFGQHRGKPFNALPEKSRAYYFDDWLPQAQAKIRNNARISPADCQFAIALQRMVDGDEDETATVSWKDELTPQKARLGEMSMVKLAEMARHIGQMPEPSEMSVWMRDLVLSTALPELIAACTVRGDLSVLMTFLDNTGEGGADDAEENKVFNTAMSRYETLQTS